MSALLLAMATQISLHSGEWFQWRGPNRDGHAADQGLLKQWPAGGPSLAWKTSGIGAGYSSVSVQGSTVFTMGETGDANAVHALNLADGKLRWSTPLGKAGAPGWGGFAGPRCTPTVDGDRLYVIGQYGEFACLETASGKMLWRKHLVDDFGGKLPEWGFSESPLVDGDNVMFTPGGEKGTVIALNKKSGEVVWRCAQAKDNAAYASLIIAEIDGVRQYIQLTDEHVIGVAAKDGALLWQAVRKGRTAVITTPIYHDHHVYVSSGYGVGCNLFKVGKQGDTFKAEQVYANKVMVNHHGGVVLVGQHLYGHSEGKGWTCQDLLTGEAVWQEKEKLGKGSVTFADGLLYLRHEEGDGTVALVEATPSGFKEKGRFNQPDRSKKNSWPHPTISGGRLFLRDQDLLLCYNLK